MMLHLVLSLLFWSCTPRSYSQPVFIHQFRRTYGWQFIDRMVLQPGQSSASLKVSLIAKDYPSAYTLQFAAVLDSEWDQEVSLKCAHSNPLTASLVLSKQNNYIQTVKLPFAVASHTTYHFLLRDCQRMLINDPLDHAAYLTLEIQILNNQTPHSTLQHYTFIFTMVILLYNAVLLRVLRRIVPEDQYQWEVLFMKVAQYMNVIALSFRVLCWVLYLYVVDKEYSGIQFFYLGFHFFADSLVSSLLTMFAFGWQILFKKSDEFDLYLPLLGMLGVINVLMALISKITDGAHDKRHMHDSIPAYILFGFKFLAFVIFIIGTVSSALENNLERRRKVRKFMLFIAPLGVAYLLSVPLGSFIVGYFEAGSRKDLVFIFIEGAKCVVHGCLVYMLAAKTSMYNQLTGESFMQKGNKYY